MSLLPPILTMNDFTDPEIKEIEALRNLKLTSFCQRNLLDAINPSARAAFELLNDQYEALIADHNKTIEHQAHGRMAWKKAGF